MGAHPGDERFPNRTEGVTTTALTLRTRVGTNAGLGTVDDVRLANRKPGVGPGRPADGADPVALLLSPSLEAGVGGDRRRWPSVDGADDLAAVDALQVDAGMPRFACPSWRCMTPRGTPWCAISTAWACLSWCLCRRRHNGF